MHGGFLDLLLSTNARLWDLLADSGNHATIPLSIVSFKLENSSHSMESSHLEMPRLKTLYSHPIAIPMLRWKGFGIELEKMVIVVGQTFVFEVPNKT